MPKKIESPSSFWPGFVVFADPLSLPQALAWEKSIRAAVELGTTTQTELDMAFEPGVLACIEKCELQGLPEKLEFVPSSPRQAAKDLMAWLIGEVSKIYSGSGDVEDPNE
jgi:hypothetical protein